MNGVLLFLLLGCTSIVVLVSMLLYFHGKILFKNLTHCMKPYLFRKHVNKDLIAYQQQWKCASCRGVILSNFRITTIDNLDYAICNACSPQYRCIDHV